MRVLSALVLFTVSLVALPIAAKSPFSTGEAYFSHLAGPAGEGADLRLPPYAELVVNDVPTGGKLPISANGRVEYTAELLIFVTPKLVREEDGQGIAPGINKVLVSDLVVYNLASGTGYISDRFDAVINPAAEGFKIDVSDVVDGTALGVNLTKTKEPDKGRVVGTVSIGRIVYTSTTEPLPF